jgi:SAM-dependent methyltransferase
MDDLGWQPESRWQQSLGNLRNQVRQELVSRQLAEHLPPPRDDLHILDVGCGQGTQILRLAALGYQVTGADISPRLLDQAQRSRDLLPAETRSRIQLIQADIAELSDALDHKYDVVLCHGLLMYLPSLEEALQRLVSVQTSSATISVLTRNRASIAMRAGMLGDWRTAIDGFDARFYDNRIGFEGARADEPAEVIGALQVFGVDLIAWYGVRLFTDHWESGETPEYFDDLLTAELEAGRRDPYRHLTSLTHVIGRSA